MFIRQLTPERFDSVQKYFLNTAQREPFDAAYYFDVQVNDICYRLRLYVLDRCRIMPVQAIRLHRDPAQYRLITDPTQLGALVEVLLM